jgi:hypothetical protein
MKHLPFPFLLTLLLTGCGMDFQKSTHLALTASQATYYGAMEVIDIAESQGRIVHPAVAMEILEFEDTYRGAHNTSEELIEQWMILKEGGADKGHLERLEWEIRNYTALAARAAAELMGFLKRIGLYGED